MTDVKVMSVTFLLNVLEIVIDSVMDPTFHVTMSHTTDMWCTCANVVVTCATNTLLQASVHLALRSDLCRICCALHLAACCVRNLEFPSIDGQRRFVSISTDRKRCHLLPCQREDRQACRTRIGTSLGRPNGLHGGVSHVTDDAIFCMCCEVSLL